MTGSANLLELRAISKSYGHESILRDCDLELRRGERIALLGKSGCGKSTVLRLLAGLDTPTAGEVLVGGVVASLPRKVVIPPHERHLSMVFQDLALWPAETVFENVLLGLAGSRAPRDRRRARAEAALELCHIAHLAKRFPGTLSGGEQQRVALARALAGDPAVLLLDEPFAGLDLSTKRELLTEIRSVIDERNLGICLVTHDPLEAVSLCTGAAALDDGRVLEHGPWEALLTDPQSAPLRAFREAFHSAELLSSVARCSA